MRKNKSNMYTVQGYKQNGNPAELLIEESVDFCPFCLRTQNLNRENVLKMVGPTGFEPATPTTPRWCATRLRHGPTACCVFSRSWSVCHAFVKIRAVAQILSI
jgi:hypothetical protein